MHFIEQIKNKLINKHTIKLLFYSIVVFLVILPISKNTSPSVQKKTLKHQGKSHIREPTNNENLLILEEKKRFVVNLPKNNVVHYKEQNKPHYRMIDAIITAYTANQESSGKTPNDPAYKITASGKKVQEGVTLACPKQYPFGTVVMIQGVGKRVCQDLGSAIKNNKFDLYMGSYDKAISFGVQHRKITILGGKYDE